MPLNLPFSLARVFIHLTVNGVKSIAEGYEDVLTLFMLCNWFPVDNKLSFRTADINSGFEEPAFLMVLGRSLHYDVAADNLRMVTG